MSLRTQRSLQTLILAALGVFLLGKIFSGTLYWYINQRFMVLVLAAGIGLLALAQVMFQSLRQKPEPHEHQEHADHHSQDQHPGHAHGTLPAWGLVVVALPVLLGLLIPARPLGTSAIVNKGVNTGAPITAGSGTSVTLGIAPENRTVLDWVRVFNYEADPTVFDGQPADVVGFVYHDPRLPEGQFLVGRFTLNCCVADASAIGMAVAWPEEDDLADNSWVRVRGAMQAASLNGKPLPLINAASIEQVAEPEQPYLYP
jgi:uncharacterized repeat protein (TIGR03943 family)